jgi:hypothetical protein
MLNIELPDSTELQLADHPLFKAGHWDEMLMGEERGVSSLTSNKEGDYELSIRSNVINYDNEIELFLNFISPYVINFGLCGWMIREDEENLTLIFSDFPNFRLQKIIKVEEKFINDDFVLNVGKKNRR